MRFGPTELFILAVVAIGIVAYLRYARNRSGTSGFLGGLAGGFVGFLLRPSVPIVGQLPFETVITRGANLRGLDELLISTAQTSFNYMLAGALAGALIGAAIGRFMPKKGTSG